MGIMVGSVLFSFRLLTLVRVNYREFILNTHSAPTQHTHSHGANLPVSLLRDTASVI